MTNMQSSHLNNFDLLRFIAAIAVIFSHSFALTSGQGDPLNIISKGLVDFGGLAVATFFSISGYLISASYIRRSELLPFFLARILRIFPGLIIAVLFCALIIGPLNTHVTMTDYFTNTQTYNYLFKNGLLLHSHPWDFLPGVFNNNPYPNAVNGSLWTLPLECLLYFILGLTGTLGLLTKAKLRPFFLVLAFASLYFLQVKQGTSLLSSHFLRDYLPSICCFILGALYYIYRDKITINYIILAILVILSMLIPPHYFLCFFYITFSYAVLFVAVELPYLSGLFKKYGDVSYGLYIYAFPIQQTLVHYLPLNNPYYLFLTALPLTLICAMLSWHFLEKPALQYKTKLPSWLLLKVTKYFALYE